MLLHMKDVIHQRAPCPWIAHTYTKRKVGVKAFASARIKLFKQHQMETNVGVVMRCHRNLQRLINQNATLNVLDTVLRCVRYPSSWILDR